MELAVGRGDGTEVTPPLLLCHLHVIFSLLSESPERIALPRQARDNDRHRENMYDNVYSPVILTSDKPEKRPRCFVFRVSSFALSGLFVGEKNVLFEPFICKHDHFTKTGSGRT